MVKVCIYALILCVACPVTAGVEQGNEDIRAILKMSPKDVLRLRGAVEHREHAMYRETRDPVVYSDESELSLEPGEKTQEIYLLQRSPTTLSFYDITGTPWPIVNIEAYDGELIGAKVIENTYNNSAVLHGILPAGSAYITVFLEGQSASITIKATVSSDKYHKKKTLKIMEVGPKTNVSQKNISAAMQVGLKADPDLNNVLYGVTPYGAKKLITGNEDFLAWEKEGDILIRTRQEIFSPKHKRIKPGTNEYTAYRLPNTSRVYASNSTGQVISIVLRDK